MINDYAQIVKPDILALDFDGVLCDGRAEYLESSWRAYRELWNCSELDLETIAPDFYSLRPVIETGWEMPLLLRALVKGISKTDIFENWSSLVAWLLKQEGLNWEEMARLLDAKRDRWLEQDETDWLAHHQFYPGVIKRLQSILEQQRLPIYIITTKEGRFADKLLAQQGLNFPSDAIVGKEKQQPKTETLKKLRQTQHNCSIWFVEDRLATLLEVQKSPCLQTVRLFLAAWGYNTMQSQQAAIANPNIKLLSLDQFNQNFSQW